MTHPTSARDMAQLIHTTHWKRLVRHARRQGVTQAEAEDIVARVAGSLIAQAADGRAIPEPLPWLLKTVSWRTRDYLRSDAVYRDTNDELRYALGTPGRQARTDEDDGGLYHTDTVLPFPTDRWPDARDREIDVSRALHTLPPKYERIVRRLFFDACPQRQVAHEARMSQSALHDLLHRVIYPALRRELAAYDTRPTAGPRVVSIMSSTVLAWLLAG